MVTKTRRTLTGEGQGKSKEAITPPKPEGVMPSTITTPCQELVQVKLEAKEKVQYAPEAWRREVFCYCNSVFETTL